MVTAASTVTRRTSLAVSGISVIVAEFLMTTSFMHAAVFSLSAPMVVHRLDTCRLSYRLVKLQAPSIERLWTSEKPGAAGFVDPRYSVVACRVEFRKKTNRLVRAALTIMSAIKLQTNKKEVNRTLLC